MTTDEPRLSAGWYSDPDASTGERWWNGSQWTSHIRPGPSPDEMARLSGEAPTDWSSDDQPLATVSASPSGMASAAVHPLAVAAPQAPGWYPDPAGAPVQRWWDGNAWSAQTAPGQAVSHYSAAGHSHVQVPYGSTTVVTVPPTKSVGIALLLTFLFGPFGMFYSTVSGAVIMLGVLFVGGLLVGIFTFGLAWIVWGPLVWFASMIWGAMAAADQSRAPVISTYR